MSLGPPSFASLGLYRDPRSGVTERFLQPTFDGTRTVAVLSMPLSDPLPFGWIITHSFGMEQVHLAPLEVALARRLAAMGYPVLRFHARGCGDSEAPTETYTLRSHAEDTAKIAESLLESGAVERVGIIGGLLGGSMAAVAAAKVGAAGLILWEPIVRGTDYLQVLARSAMVVELANGTKAAAAEHDPLELLARAGVVDVQGFPLRLEVADELRAFDLLGHDPSPLAAASLILQIGRTDAPRAQLQRLADRIEARGGRGTLEVVNHADAWMFGQSRYRSVEKGGKLDRQESLSEAILERTLRWVRSGSFADAARAMRPA